jgi:hypothetical protein
MVSAGRLMNVHQTRAWVEQIWNSEKPSIFHESIFLFIRCSSDIFTPFFERILLARLLRRLTMIRRARKFLSNYDGDLLIMRGFPVGNVEFFYWLLFVLHVHFLYIS